MDGANVLQAGWMSTVQSLFFPMSGAQRFRHVRIARYHNPACASLGDSNAAATSATGGTASAATDVAARTTADAIAVAVAATAAATSANTMTSDVSDANCTTYTNSQRSNDNSIARAAFHDERRYGAIGWWPVNDGSASNTSRPGTRNKLRHEVEPMWRRGLSIVLRGSIRLPAEKPHPQLLLVRRCHLRRTS